MVFNPILTLDGEESFQINCSARLGTKAQQTDWFFILS